MPDSDKHFLNLAKFVLESRQDDSEALIRKIVRQIAESRPDLSSQVNGVVKLLGMSSPTRGVPLVAEPVPVDGDSRMELLKVEYGVSVDRVPVWTSNLRDDLESIFEERSREAELLDVGLMPTRSLLFVGPPGVGKTLAAKWLSNKLEKPLMTLDLASVMSSYLGKTGNNIRAALNYAQKQPSILLLDEFDAIAKRRDDSSEVGELKRLVTVLLQAVDEWPKRSLLIAATNHPELLDPAIWRRFDKVIEFSKPSQDEIRSYIHSYFKGPFCLDQKIANLLAVLLDKLSFAEIEKHLNSLTRDAVLKKISIDDCANRFITSRIKLFDLEYKLDFAKILEKNDYSQRQIRDLTGCSRDTLRDHGIAKKSKDLSQ